MRERVMLKLKLEEGGAERALGWRQDEWEMRWETEYKGRMAVSGFLKDKHIGSKRLISMPDRITNTINRCAPLSRAHALSSLPHALSHPLGAEPVGLGARAATGAS